MQKNAKQDVLRLENQLCFPLYAASRLIIQAYGPMLAKLKLTYPQYLVLLVLWEQDGLSVKQIGDKLLLDSGTLTPVLKKMFQLGWILRSRSPDDDREVQNFLTRKAENIREKAADLSIELFCSTGMSEKEAVDLRTLTKSLLAKLVVRQDKA